MEQVKLVGEIGINHNGDINLAKRLIDVARVAKLDYVKFQKRTPEDCVPLKQQGKMRETPWGYITYLEYKHKIEFGRKEYKEIDKYCRGSDNIKWFASSWDPSSAKFLSEFDCPYIKIASACITNFDMLEVVKNVGKPVVMSTGMSTKKEVDKCIDFLGNQIEYILACTSSYPTKDEDVNLNFIKVLKKEYPKYKIGFSNHHPGVQCCFAAAVLGAEMIEFHITLNRALFGTDQATSIETPGVLALSKHIRVLEKTLGTGEWTITPEEEKIREKLRK